MSAGEILKALNARREQTGRKIAGWPSQPEDVGKLLNRLAPTLGGVGIKAERLPRSKKSRPWLLKRVAGPSQPPPVSPTPDFEPVEPPMMGDSPDDGYEFPEALPSSVEALFEPEGDAGDGGDGSAPTLEVRETRM